MARVESTLRGESNQCRKCDALLRICSAYATNAGARTNCYWLNGGQSRISYQFRVSTDTLDRWSEIRPPWLLHLLQCTRLWCAAHDVLLPCLLSPSPAATCSYCPAGSELFGSGCRVCEGQSVSNDGKQCTGHHKRRVAIADFVSPLYRRTLCCSLGTERREDGMRLPGCWECGCQWQLPSLRSWRLCHLRK